MDFNFLSGLGDTWGQAGGWIDSIANVADDARAIWDAIDGRSSRNPAGGVLPGFVPNFGVPPSASVDDSGSSGLLVLGLVGIAAFLLLRKG